MHSAAITTTTTTTTTTAAAATTITTTTMNMRVLDCVYAYVRVYAIITGCACERIKQDADISIYYCLCA